MPTKLNFRERAAKLGFSADLLKPGIEIKTAIQVPDIETLRFMLDFGETEAERAANAKILFGDIPLTDPDKDASEAGILRRVDEYLYGNGILAAVDRQRITQLFPMTLNVLLADDKTISGKWDLTGIPVVDVGTLTMQNQSYIVTNASALTFTADNIVRNGTPPATFSDFNILGSTGATGATGTQPGPGSAGQGGSKGTCKSPGVAGNPGGPGTTGGTGSTGGPGAPGRTGGSSQQATIVITNGFTGAQTLSIVTRSGTGGVGGQGGTGGQGGQGGVGGDGATCGCEGTNGGPGAPGGPGGQGGPGGPGGSPTSFAGNIIFRVPAAQTESVIQTSSPVGPGGGGTGGTGGVGGAGAGGGSAGKHQSGGNQGGTGGGGSPGGYGPGGTGQGTPATISVQPV